MKEDKAIIEARLRRGVGRVLDELLSQRPDFEILVEEEDGAMSVGVDVIGVERSRVESAVVREMQRLGLRDVAPVDPSVLDPSEGVRIYGRQA